jgi:hypothetical protein
MMTSNFYLLFLAIPLLFFFVWTGMKVFITLKASKGSRLADKLLEVLKRIPMLDPYYKRYNKEKDDEK